MGGKNEKNSKKEKVLWKKAEKLKKKRKNDSFYCVNLQKIARCFSIRAWVLK